MGNVPMPLKDDSKFLYLIREPGVDLVVIFAILQQEDDIVHRRAY